MKKVTKPQTSKVPAAKAVKRRTAVDVQVVTEETLYRSVAKVLARPEVGAACAIEKWQPDTHDVNDLTAELAAQVAAVNAGDLARAEAMLVSQAHTLDMVFNHLVLRASAQSMGSHWETYMRMAMKAQNQCRMTLATLVEMKNPQPVAFVKQANISHGPQQVNNGAELPQSLTRAGAHGEANRIEPNKLLEATHGEWLEFGAPGATVGAHSDLETVGAVDRPAKR